MLLASGGACGGRGKQPTEQAAAKTVEPAEALRPDVLGKALRRLGGAHFHATTRLTVGQSASPNSAQRVSTTTDVWMDRAGNYRLREENDRDGGREVVLVGRELSVALRYGKMIRRIAEEPEPTRLLEQALGGLWGGWELAGPVAVVKKAGAELYSGAKATVYDLALDGKAAVAPRADALVGALPFAGLRSWRSTAIVEGLSGKVVVDDATGAVDRADLLAKFSAKGEGGPITGEMEVHAALTEMGGTQPIARPEAETLAFRQRIVPEQKELLRGLAQDRPPEVPRRPTGRPSPTRAAPTGAKATAPKAPPPAAPKKGVP